MPGLLLQPEHLRDWFLGYIAQQSYDIVGVGETHLLPQALGEARQKMRVLGRNSAFTAAGPYQDVAAAGGTSLHSMRRLAPAILVDSDHALPGGEAPWDWTAMAVPFLGFEVIMVSIYMHASIGYCRPKCEKAGTVDQLACNADITLGGDG